MKTKTLASALLFSVALISCAPVIESAPKAIPVFTETPTIAPTSTIFWITPVFSLTVEPTITPDFVEPFIPQNNTDDISNIVVQIYSIKPECAHSVFIEHPDIKTKVEFTEITEPSLLDVRWVQAVANNPDKNRQATITCVADSPEWQGCYDHVYMKDQSSLKVYEIGVDGHLPWRPIFNIIWIGNDVLAFTENSSPAVDTIYAIDVNKKEYVYYSSYYGQCK